MPRKIGTAILAALALAACSSINATPDATADRQAGTPSATPSPSAIATESSNAPSPTGQARYVTCENPTLGYVIGYPQGWWANEAVEGEGAVEDVAPCQYFAPSPVAIEPGTDDLGGIAIRLEIEEGDNAPTGDVLRRRVTTIDGRDATVREVEVPPQAGFVPEGSIAYQYVIELSDGRSLVATADNIHVEPATYEEATAVLDRMMERIEVGGPTA